MLIQTTRFGEIDIDDSRSITFPSGLLGFARYTRYVLLACDAGDCRPVAEEPAATFWWLQSVEAPDLAFVVTQPELFVPGYAPTLHEEHLDRLDMHDIGEAQTLIIVNKRDGILTGNLQGPLILNPHARLGEQLVLSERRFTTRFPLIELNPSLAAAG